MFDYLFFKEVDNFCDNWEIRLFVWFLGLGDLGEYKIGVNKLLVFDWFVGFYFLMIKI